MNSTNDNTCSSESDKEYQRQYYLKNKERKLQRLKERRLENPEIFKQRCRDYYKRNKEKINIQHQKNYEDNKDAVYARHMEWLRNNREKSKAHRFVNKNNQRGSECVLCSVFKNLNQEYSVNINRFLGDEANLDFHHTNYELNEGVTLCRMHHIEYHKFMEVTA